MKLGCYDVVQCQTNPIGTSSTLSHGLIGVSEASRAGEKEPFKFWNRGSAANPRNHFLIACAL